MQTPKPQTAKDKLWNDESGQAIPYNRTTALERMREKSAYSLAKEALAIHHKLVAFKEQVAQQCQAIYEEAMREAAQLGKGNFTFYNFDYSIKVEVQISDLIRFDDLTIEQARLLLTDLVGENIKEESEFIKSLVLDAFQTSKGKLDTKKVLGLKRHASRIKDERYHEAMTLIDKAIRRPETKTYFAISIRNEEGEYEAIQLNFSAI